MSNKTSNKLSDQQIQDSFNKLGLLSKTDREKFNFSRFDKGFQNNKDQEITFYFLAGPELLKEKESEGA